jgi:DnaJ-class molecular chaperone
MILCDFCDKEAAVPQIHLSGKNICRKCLLEKTGVTVDEVTWVTTTYPPIGPFRCPDCNGTGIVPGVSIQPYCPTCHGTGAVNFREG